MPIFDGTPAQQQVRLYLYRLTTLLSGYETDIVQGMSLPRRRRFRIAEEAETDGVRECSRWCRCFYANYPGYPMK